MVPKECQWAKYMTSPIKSSQLDFIAILAKTLAISTSKLKIKRYHVGAGRKEAGKRKEEFKSAERGLPWWGNVE